MVPDLSRESRCRYLQSSRVLRKIVLGILGLEDGDKTFLRIVGNRYPVKHRQVAEERCPQRLVPPRIDEQCP